MAASDSQAPQINPAEIAGWPLLRIVYRTDPDKVAALLPPGIDAGSEPNVHLTVYNVPVLEEPEYGVTIKVDADYRGIAGQYTLGYGIDQEAAVFISQEINGQPKFPASIRYFRFGDKVEARASHQGYTFLEFHGSVARTLPNPPDQTDNEWWIKSSRAVGGVEKSYDFPPHVVRVHSTSGTALLQELEGTLVLRESPWDPIATRLPQRELVSAVLRTSVHKSREITLEGPLDLEAFWPYADVIGGSRWPGTRGGPKRG